MEFTSRGRKSNISDKQLELVSIQIKKSPDKYVKFISFAMPKEIVDIKAQKNHKAAVSSMLRQMGKKLGYKSKIRWNINNIPCVLFTK